MRAAIWAFVLVATFGVEPLSSTMWAVEEAHPESKFSSSHENPRAPAPAAAGQPPASPEACLADEVAIGDLRRQREEIEALKKDLAAKEAELAARETALNEEIKKLEELRDDIGKIDQSRKKDNEERVSKLIETLEGMSPKAAAAMLSTMEEALAVQAIYRMDTAKVAKVLGKIEPGKSSKLVEIMAGVVRAKRGEAGLTRPLPRPASKAAPDAAETANPAKGGENQNGKSDQQQQQQQQQRS